MLICAVERADVALRPMAFQADLLRRPRFIRDVDRPIEVAEPRVVQLFYTIALGLEVSSRAGTNMAFDTRDLGMRSALRSNKLRLHWHMAALAAKIDRLRVLVGLVAAEGSQKKKADGTEREQCENPPATFPRQIDLENATFLFNLRRATLLTFVQDRAEKGECEAEEEEKRSDHIREDANVRILCGREEIDREKKDKSE